MQRVLGIVVKEHVLSTFKENLSNLNMKAVITLRRKSCVKNESKYKGHYTQEGLAENQKSVRGFSTVGSCVALDFVCG